jgi:hypothetical protein
MAYCAIQISHHPQKVTGDSKTSVIRASGGKIMTYVDFSITAQHNEHRRWGWQRETVWERALGGLYEFKREANARGFGVQREEQNCP